MHRKTRRLAGAWLAAVGLVAAAAAQPPSPAEQAEAMSRLPDWAGEWEGEGWTQIGPDGERRPFRIRESIESRLDGTVLLVQGVGTAPAQEGAEPVVVHDALAVLYWEAERGYRFQTHTALGRHGVADFELLEDGRMRWGFDSPGGAVRFTIAIEGDRWTETGEISREGEWFQFHWMELVRVTTG